MGQILLMFCSVFLSQTVLFDEIEMLQCARLGVAVLRQCYDVQGIGGFIDGNTALERDIGSVSACGG